MFSLPLFKEDAFKKNEFVKRKINTSAKTTVKQHQLMFIKTKSQPKYTKSSKCKK